MGRPSRFNGKPNADLRTGPSGLEFTPKPPPNKALQLPGAQRRSIDPW
jgi:hypothetical protein